MEWVFLPSLSCCTSSSNCCITRSVATWCSFAWEHLAALVRVFYFFHLLSVEKKSVRRSTWLSLPVGLAPGTVVVTDKAVDYSFRPQFEQVVLGKVITRSTELDEGVSSELLQCSSELNSFPTVIGNTMCTHDFYEGSASTSTHAQVFITEARPEVPNSGSLQARGAWMERSAPSLTKKSWSI